MYLSDDDVAELLGISTQELRKKLYGGENLPPSCKIPGFRKRIWIADSVNDWLSGFEAVTDQSSIDDQISKTGWGKYR